MRICDRFSVILFDMNDTFMFGGDRFGEDEETLFVGDSLDFDIAPARDLGMRTAWITPNVSNAREIVSADYVLPTILALNTAS